MKITVSSDVRLPANDVWRFAAERFGDTGLWAARLDSSHLAGELGVGATRVCRAGDDVTEEQIIAYDPDAMTLTYRQVNPPSIVARATNSWSVTARSPSTSQLAMRVELDLVWWARPLAVPMRLFVKRVLREAQEEFVHWAKTGELHPRKQARARRMVST